LPAVEARGCNVDEEDEDTIVRPIPRTLNDFWGGRLYISKPHLLIFEKIVNNIKCINARAKGQLNGGNKMYKC
jgi:hypothetical protein